MTRVPRYRADVKGNVAANLADCVNAMAGEITSADYFILHWEDCENAVREYADILTDAELARCFKRAAKGAA